MQVMEYKKCKETFSFLEKGIAELSKQIQFILSQEYYSQQILIPKPPIRALFYVGIGEIFNLGERYVIRNLLQLNRVHKTKFFSISSSQGLIYLLIFHNYYQSEASSALRKWESFNDFHAVACRCGWFKCVSLCQLGQVLAVHTDFPTICIKLDYL